MPAAPLRFCSYPRCGERVRSGRCKAHRSEQRSIADARRGSRHERGYTNAWAAYSRRRLIDHPWCVGFPVGVHPVPTLAECTDHKQSARARPDLFWDPSNHQSLCLACNTRKAMAEER